MRKIDAILTALAALRVELRQSPSKSDRPSLIEQSARESGLHPAALKDLLGRWYATVESGEAFERLAASALPRRAGNVVTLCPGNVPVVALECLILSILAGGEQNVMLSTRSTALPLTFLSHLSAALGSDLETKAMVWRKLSSHQRGTLLGAADRVIVYGDERTVGWIRNAVPTRTKVLEHGPSLTVAVARQGRLGDPEVEGLCRDVAAYDQRGCRSPHVLISVGSNATDLDATAARLSNGLDDTARLWPLGEPTEEERYSTFLDRITSSNLGDIVQSEGGTVTVEANPVALRHSPLRRTLRLYGVPDMAAAETLIRSSADPVGLLLSPMADPMEELSTRLSIPETSDIGRAQQPTFDRIHDGRHRLDELRVDLP
ncbi:MAG: hypothetical protein KC561_03255 [Myxococcales bacterium]|nr:hypothetical protein [Myxococcales bacterium]